MLKHFTRLDLAQVYASGEPTVYPRSFQGGRIDRTPNLDEQESSSRYLPRMEELDYRQD